MAYTGAVLKPRKKITFGAPTLPTAKVATASRAPTQPKAPAPFTPAAAPAAHVTPPPAPTLSSASDRIGAREGYGGVVTDVNAQMRKLASDYGFAPSVAQFGWDPNAWNSAAGTFGGDSQSSLAVAPNQPGSTADVLLRNLQGQQRNVDETAETNNTFFSGRRLDDRARADTDYGAQVAQAQREFDDAVRTLTNSITSGRSQRDTTFRNADISDLQNAQSAPPEAQAAAPPAAAASAGPVAYSGPKGLQSVRGQQVYIDSTGGQHAVQTVGAKRYYLTGSGKWQAF